MFLIKVMDETIIFSRFFSEKETNTVEQAIAGPRPRKVLFVDTPTNNHLLDLVGKLVAKGKKVVIRDHHNHPYPATTREEEINKLVSQLASIVDPSSILTDREQAPACSRLVGIGEFQGWTIVADPDADGLTASLKALGIVYPGLDEDAVIMDGPRADQHGGNLTPLGNLLVKGMASLPPFDPRNPSRAEMAKKELFQQFADAVQGNEESLAQLEYRVKEYDMMVHRAINLYFNKSVPISPYVRFCDVVGALPYDGATLFSKLEQGNKMTVIRKNSGPIAHKNDGVQYTIAVTRTWKEMINLQTVLPEGFISSPEEGIISNTSFLLHLSEEKWEELKSAILDLAEPKNTREE